MEFQGRIAKVLQMRTGVSERTGNQWQALPFVFEYFEHENDRYADSVLLETYDTNIIAGICKCCEHDGTGNLIVENGAMKLTREIQCVCGFGHKAKPFTTKQGENKILNELRLYKLESVKGAQSQNQPAQGANVQQANSYQCNQNGGAQQPPFGQNQPFQPQVDQYGNPLNQGGKDDDLPF